MEWDLARIISTLAGLLISAWGFWRLNIAPARGEWPLKIATLAIFATSSLWVLDRLTGNTWRWDHAALLVAVALYLWAGVWSHYRSRRRSDRVLWTSEGRP